MRTTNVIGTECSNTSYAELVAFLNDRCREEGTTAVDFTNVHIVAMRREDAGFRESLAETDFFVPDSQVLFFTVKALGGRMEERVYGPTYMRHGVLGAPAPHTHYFLGGSAECLERLEANFEAKSGGAVKVIGRHDGYFGEEDDEAIVEEINRLSPDFVWVGLGTPKQQYWIAKNRGKIERGVLLAVGFAFDVNAGTKKDAPALFQKLGLTWFYRLCSEPRRLWWRYFKYNSLYLWYLMKQVVFREKWEPK